MRIKTLQEALTEYQNYLPNHDCGKHSYSEVESSKIDIADALLFQLGIPLGPRPSPYRNELERAADQVLKVLKHIEDDSWWWTKAKEAYDELRKARGI